MTSSSRNGLSSRTYNLGAGAMPVLINTKEFDGGTQVDLENGVPLDLTDDQRQQVVLTKYISNNPARADWQPEGEWIEEVTSDVASRKRNPRIVLEKEGRGVQIDDGLIIRLKGTLSGLVGILPGQPPMTEAQVDAYRDATDQAVPMYQQWDFRVERILQTNGPQAREALARSEDQKRQAAQTDMYNAIAKAFQQGQAAMNQEGEISPSGEQAYEKGTSKLAGGGSKK